MREHVETAWGRVRARSGRRGAQHAIAMLGALALVAALAGTAPGAADAGPGARATGSRTAAPTKVPAAKPAVPVAEDSNGFASITITEDKATSTYGDTVHFFGEVHDESQSCASPVGTCDIPTGLITLSYSDGTTTHNIGFGALSPSGDADDFAAYDIPVTGLPAGTYVVNAAYSEGNFDDTNTIGFDAHHTVLPVTCAPSISQSSPASNPGASVTFTADFGALGNRFSGNVVFSDSTGLLANPAVVYDAGTTHTTASFSTSGLSQGHTIVKAFWTHPNDSYADCDFGSVDHFVSNDLPPVAGDDSYGTLMNTPVVMHLFDNDSDDNGIDHVEFLNSPENGEIDGFDDDTGVGTYVPDEDFAGDDGFDYEIFDAIGQGTVAHVNIAVDCVPDAVNDSFTVNTSPYEAVPYALLDNDFYCDSSTPTILSQPAHGAVVLHAFGAFTYTPVTDYEGPDSFTYGYEGSNDQATVSLTVDIDWSTVTTTEPPTSTTTSTTTTTEPPTSTTTSTTEPPTSTTTSTTEPPTSTTEPPTSTTTSTTEPPTSTTEPPTSTTTSTSTTTTTAPTTTTTTTPPPTVSEDHVTAWYESLLGRAPDPGGLGHWAGQLDAGVSARTVAKRIIGSTEFRRRLVRDAYHVCLGRSADPSGLAYWVGKLAGGTSPDRLRVELLASNEAWTQAGHDAADWAGAAYDALLGRAPSVAERSQVIAALRAGSSRRATALALATRPEAHRHRAAFWYDALLGRPPTAEEAIDWADAMAIGTPELTLVAELAATLAD